MRTRQTSPKCVSMIEYSNCSYSTHSVQQKKRQTSAHWFGARALVWQNCFIRYKNPFEVQGNNRERNKMTNESEIWDISICGLNCAKCDIFVESKECQGCRGSLDRHWSPDCQFLPCATKKGHQYCFECDDFPCDRLQAFASDGWAHHKRAVENLKRMKEIGIAGWIAEQEKCEFCP